MCTLYVPPLLLPADFKEQAGSSQSCARPLQEALLKQVRCECMGWFPMVETSRVLLAIFFLKNREFATKYSIFRKLCCHLVIFRENKIHCFWPAEGTSQPVIISKKWKNTSYAFKQKRDWVEALPWFSTYSLDLPALGTDLKSWKGLYSGPSPIQD
jgi:hypothetical protein